MEPDALSRLVADRSLAVAIVICFLVFAGAAVPAAWIVGTRGARWAAAKADQFIEKFSDYLDRTEARLGEIAVVAGKTDERLAGVEVIVNQIEDDLRGLAATGQADKRDNEHHFRNIRHSVALIAERLKYAEASIRDAADRESAAG